MIRRLKSDDLASLARVEEEAFADPWRHDQIVATVEASPSLALVYLADQVIVAYLLFLCGPGEADLLRIATVPDHRRKGIARDLLLEGIEELRRMSFERIHLEVRHQNAAARALYEALSFVETGRRPGYYRGVEDGILYALELYP